MASLMLAAILMCLISASTAYDFYVGGGAGWVENPKESYNNWASRMRFQVNDKLVFKYKKTGDSILVVKKEDYDSCNVNSPIQELKGGDSAFQFTRSGPFYFISGAQDRCAKGQKMTVVVMAVRGKNPLPPPPPAAVQPPSLQPPTLSPSSSPSPSLSPPSTMAPTPSPSASPPAAPTPSPSSGEPSLSPSPSSLMAPTPSPSASPPTAPTPSPSSGGPLPSPPPMGLPPAETPSSGNGGVVPAGNDPAKSPASAPPANSSSSALTSSRVTIGTVVLVLAHAFLG